MPEIFTPARLGPLTLKNRVVKAATYEGLSHRSRVTTDLVTSIARTPRAGSR